MTKMKSKAQSQLERMVANSARQVKKAPKRWKRSQGLSSDAAKKL